MKKPLLIPLILCLAAVLAGCSPGELADNLLRHGDRAEETTPPKERVYMDEISGQLASFDGTTMVLISDNLHYTFDLSEATLECRHGILSGSKISVIYEGRMNDNDTSTVKALKVADVIHGMEEPKDQMVTGHIQNMSTYYCTFRTEDGKLITFPITGAKQYYQNGLNSDSLMYLHYIGDLVWQEGSDRADASHVRVVSISDVDPYKAPAWKELVDGLDNKNYSNIHGSVRSINGSVVTLTLKGFKTDLQLDLSKEMTFFQGGFLPNTQVNLRYTGTLPGNDTLGNVHILSVAGDNPDKVKTEKLTGTINGTVVGYTADTVTVQTADGTRILCRTANVPDSSTGGLLTGAGVSIIPDLSASKGTNIFESVSIRDIY